MRHRYRLRETGWAEFGYFLCYFNGCSQSSRFPTAGKGNEYSGNEIEEGPEVPACACSMWMNTITLAKPVWKKMAIFSAAE